MLFNKYLHCQEVSGKHIRVSMGYGILIRNSLRRLQYRRSLMAFVPASAATPVLINELSQCSAVQWYL